ncbi:MAG TPA: GTPase [Candidatus Nanoarchaeia archaeon]|nr:GTPase [Candidatus Nanoarchaeia archaeon]
MPINAGYEYGVAEQEFLKAQTKEQKLKALQKMLSTAPKHKSSQNLIAHLKQKIAKLKIVIEKTTSKKSGAQVSVKREGAAQIAIVGTTNTGKSTLLKKLTNAQVEIADYPFTTKRPEMGILDYKGVKLQIVEIPAITKDFEKTPLGPTCLSIIKQADLIILMFNTAEEKKLLDNELKDVEVPIMIYNEQANLPDLIWERLGIIKVYTKQPGKKKDFPPVALKKGSTVEVLANKVHKDFIKKFKFARIYGKSAKFDGQVVGLNHKLADDDVLEVHVK